MTEKITLQEYFDKGAKPEFRQSLMTVENACAKVGWEFAYRPICCGQEIECNSFIGSAYHAECKTCHKWIHDINVCFGSSWVEFPGDNVDSSTLVSWIAGQDDHAVR